MGKYLTKTTEYYRLANETEVESFLKDLKADSRFDVTKYTSTKKQVKAKGEIIDEYILFQVTKVFNNEKEPDTLITVDYNMGGLAASDDEEDITNEF